MLEAHDELVGVRVLEILVDADVRVARHQVQAERIALRVVEPRELELVGDRRRGVVELTGDDAAVVAADAALEQGGAGLVQLDRGAEPRRKHVPVKQLLVGLAATDHVLVAIEQIERVEVAFAAVVAHAGVDRQPAHAHGVIHIHAHGAQAATAPERVLRVAVGRRAAVGVDVVVVAVQRLTAAAVVLHAHLEVVLRAQEVVGVLRHLAGKRRLERLAVVPIRDATSDVAGVEVLEPPCDLGAAVQRKGRCGAVEAGVARFEHRGRIDDRRVEHAGRRIVAGVQPYRARRGAQAGALGNLVEVVMRLHLQAVVLVEAVVQLPEIALGVRLGRERFGRGGLRFPVGLVLERTEEPQFVLHERPAELRGRIAEAGAVVGLVAVLGGGRVASGQRGILVVKVCIAVELVAPLARDDVEDRAGHIAILGAGTE